MARPPITAKSEGLFRQQLNAALDYVESLGGGSPAWGAITGTLADQTDLDAALDGKQATLVSGTNIKTVNGTTLLGSGDLVVSGNSGASPAVSWVI